MEVDGLIRVVARTALAPWGGSLAVLDRYEAGIRMATNLQLTFARTVRVEPIRTHRLDPGRRDARRRRRAAVGRAVVPG